MSATRAVAVWYLAIQGAAVVLWWALLWLAPATRAHFLPSTSWPESVLFAFALPDLLFAAVGSLAAALALHRGYHAARALQLLVAGGIGYATLWCIGALLVCGGGGLGALLMIASMAGTAWTLHATRL